MIRSVFVQRRVLELYRTLDVLTYPIDPSEVLDQLPCACRIMSYSDVAKASHGSVQEVISMCNSNTGATHFDAGRRQYLIMYNDAQNLGRIRWTKAHEIGHIILGHFDAMQNQCIAEGETREFARQFEQEADYFAWNLIAPLPIMREMHIDSIEQTRCTFGLSAQAAALHFDRYVKWSRSHVKTAWENNMLREFRCKYRESHP